MKYFSQQSNSPALFVANEDAPHDTVVFGGANIAPAVIRHLAAQAARPAPLSEPARYVEATASFGGANIAPAVIRHLAATH